MVEKLFSKVFNSLDELTEYVNSNNITIHMVNNTFTLFDQNEMKVKFVLLYWDRRVLNE